MSQSTSARTRILVVADKYLPGWKAGGPIRSISNLVEQLGDDLDFWLVTDDRDRGDTKPYQGVAIDTWTPVGKAQVQYKRRKALTRRVLARIIREVDPELVYLNSLLSRLSIKHLVSRRLRRKTAPPVVLSPRGELDPGALSIRPLRKRVYLAVGQAIGLFEGVTWQASTPIEAGHIKARIRGAQVEVAANLVQPPPAAPIPGPQKRPGDLRLAFVSRIGPKKNLPFLLGALRSIHGEVSLEIHGRKIEDEWAIVEQGLEDGLDHVAASYEGATNHNEVEAALSAAHFLVLPTLGESFGHAIYEALRIGRPVIISDRTPWQDLEKQHAGWDLPLEAEDEWIDTLQRCVDMDETTFRRMSVDAHALAQRWYRSGNHAADQAEVFEKALTAEPET